MILIYVRLKNTNLFAPTMRVFNSLGDEKCLKMSEWTLGIFVQKNGEINVTIPVYAYDSVLGPQRDDFSGLLPLRLFQGNERQHSEAPSL